MGDERIADLRIDEETSALVVVDMQPDFLPGGPLGVDGGDALLSPIATLMLSGRFRFVVGTQDWHPRGHVSFASSHEGREPLETIELHGHEQILWPDHCVQGTDGAALAAALPWDRANAILRKGADPRSDSYSAFRNNWDEDGERPPTGLAGYLRERGVRQIYICGLTRDFCAFWTARDGADAGFAVTFFWDLTRPVDAGNDDEVRETLREKGVRIVEGTP